MAKHLRKRRASGRAPTPVEPIEVPESTRDADRPIDMDEAFAEGPTPGEDWFAPSESEGSADDYAARMEVSLASMLMLGTTSYQRIDGMGLARKALDAPLSGDPRRDLSEDERMLLANARAWCLLVHGDLGHRTRLDDPFVLADAERYLDLALSAAPRSPYAMTTLALLQLRQGRSEEALSTARQAVDAFAGLSDHERSSRSQGGAILAMVTLALASASCGEMVAARALSSSARAVRTSLEVDDAAFAALLSQLDAILARSP